MAIDYSRIKKAKFMEHDYMCLDPSPFFDSEWDQCKRCGLRRYWYEYNVPDQTITRCSYWINGDHFDFEPKCVEKD